MIDAQVTFQKDASGKVTELTVHQGGRDTVAKKISDTVPSAPEHREISVAPDKLKYYVGSYALAPGFTLTVTLDMGQGRNSMYLARHGWEVTGFDVSKVGLEEAARHAASAGVHIKTVLASDEEFDFGRNRWDLIAILLRA